MNQIIGEREDIDEKIRKNQKKIINQKRLLKS